MEYILPVTVVFLKMMGPYGSRFSGSRMDSNDFFACPRYTQCVGASRVEDLGLVFGF